MKALTNAVQSMGSKLQKKVVHNILKSILNYNLINKSKPVKLHTAEKTFTVILQPLTNYQHSTIKEETMDQIRSQAGLSLNQTKIISGETRASLTLFRAGGIVNYPP